MAKIQHHKGHRAAREGRYPNTGDALDAIMKGFQAIIDAGQDLPPETLAWVRACERVKADFPKPSKQET